MPDRVQESRSPLACVYDGGPLDFHTLPSRYLDTWERSGVPWRIFAVYEPVGQGQHRIRYALQHPEGDWIGPIPTRDDGGIGEFELAKAARDLVALRRVHRRS